jgi:hypothetical protein
MKGELVEEHMEEYGSQIKLEYETQNHDGVNMKTGTMSGTMVCSESQYQSIPYRGHIHGRLVLITVMGRQTVCLRCGEKGHQRSTCPLLAPILRGAHFCAYLTLWGVAHDPFPPLLLLLACLYGYYQLFASRLVCHL